MKKIGKYIIRGLLGKGGMSVVYKALLPVVGRIVALKVLAPHPNLVNLLGREALGERFISEARAIASLRSPHVVNILDFDYHGGAPFFTMEYYYGDLGLLIGEAYRADLPTRALSLDKTVYYARQILDGLAALSRAGIVHRDIKPGNLMISDEDRIKICDFGFSKLRGERIERPPHLVIGSPFYAAPEQERDPDGADQRADLYSAGVIVHRMLTGLLPQDGVGRPSDRHPDADADWDRFVERALEPDPRRRFSTADEMLRDLEGLSLAWSRKKESFCRIAGEAERGGPAAGARKVLRSAPVKVGSKEAPNVFGCDALMRPLRYSEPELKHSADGSVVFDPESGLSWQASGSADPMDWHAARGYVESLNATGFAGRSLWRLPTVDELLSILRPPVLGFRDCIAPAFDRKQKTLWSCDRRTFTSAWHADMELGFAGSADFTCRFYVRAVTETG
ncbi:MAG: protein kinase [Syntrophobacteraceae bacterium]